MNFSLVIEYLTGYAVATDPASRERAEWPPHPARVFMALAAAHFETDPTNELQREALEWLATLPPPNLVVPQHTERDVLKVYVPVNDTELPDSVKAVEKLKPDAVKDKMAIFPTNRNKQDRTFPRVHVGNEPLRLTWQFESKSDIKHLDAVESVCRQVTRIGHSSSLVWARVERDASIEPTHQVDASGLGVKLRTPFGTMLQSLRDDYGQEARDTFERLQAAVERLETEKKQVKGKGAAERKKQLDEQIESKKVNITKHFKEGLPIPVRPLISHAFSYSPVAPRHEPIHTSIFDPNFIVLKESEGTPNSFGLESTAQITEAMVGLLLSNLGDRNEPIPAWVSGHEVNGDKLQSHPHLAIIPLAFVGNEYADGHLMGLGLVIPNSISFRERAKVLSPILFNANNEPQQWTIRLGRAGMWKIERDTNFSPKRNLQPLTYSAASRSWASVTPVVLDRMPKNDRVKDACAWREEVAGIIATSCTNVGLPVPVCVRVEKTPFFVGSLRAMQNKGRYRDNQKTHWVPGQAGFPQLRPGRFQVHVAIDFELEVSGPVLLGAGRFRGYGLMRPWRSQEGQ